MLHLLTDCANLGRAVGESLYIHQSFDNATQLYKYLKKCLFYNYKHYSSLSPVEKQNVKEYIIENIKLAIDNIDTIVPLHELTLNIDCCAFSVCFTVEESITVPREEYNKLFAV